MALVAHITQQDPRAAAVPVKTAPAYLLPPRPAAQATIVRAVPALRSRPGRLTLAQPMSRGAVVVALSLELEAQAASEVLLVVVVAVQTALRARERAALAGEGRSD